MSTRKALREIADKAKAMADDMNLTLDAKMRRVARGTDQLQTHTAGKARVAIETGGCVVAVGEREILECYEDGQPQTLEDEENAQRVVACWNACLGAKTEELLADAWTISKLLEQRDALVAAVTKARKRLAGTNVMGQKLDAPLVAQINAALQKGKHGA